MRNISFILTTDQIRKRTKTVTRRLGWRNLKAGDQLQAVVKCMGLKKGEKIERLAVIEVVSVRQEPLAAITDEECVREGFPQYSKEDFIQMFGHEMKVDRLHPVTRIEFKYL